MCRGGGLGKRVRVSLGVSTNMLLRRRGRIWNWTAQGMLGYTHRRRPLPQLPQDSGPPTRIPSSAPPRTLPTGGLWSVVSGCLRVFAVLREMERLK